MTDFNPLSGAVLGSTQAQHQIDIEKQRQLRRTQTLRKNVAANDDQLEHQVESSDQVPAVQDENKGQPQDRRNDSRRRHPGKDQRPHIDVKA